MSDDPKIVILESTDLIAEFNSRQSCPPAPEDGFWIRTASGRTFSIPNTDSVDWLALVNAFSKGEPVVLRVTVEKGSP